MAITERERHTLQQALADLMGPDVAATLMSHLPPSGWSDVATKHDLRELEDRIIDRTHVMLADLRVELYGEIGALRNELYGEIGALRTEMLGEIGSLRSEMPGEIGSLRSEMHAEFGSLRREMQAMTRTYILGNVGLVFTVAAMAFGAARLV